MSTNLSKIKRDNMIDLIGELKDELKGDQDKLTALLDIENEIREKKYGLVWEEHEEAVDKELETKVPVFNEDKDREIKMGDEKVNFILEGDNLHSLYLLEKTHRGKIDVIYIDPPYNTGKNDFKYGDKMICEDDGYRHSKWLSFMSKRLEIARELLTDEGVIFISIDDRELYPLKMLCDDIFGDKNFINNIIWTYGKMSNESKKFSNNHEYVLVYGKTQHSKCVPKIKKEDTEYKTRWKNFVRDNKIFYIDVKKKNDKMIHKRIKKAEQELGTKLPDDYVLYDFDKEYKVDSDVIYSPIIKGNAEERVDGFGLGQKPLDLIKRLITSHPKEKEAIFLDFFAGSGTTGQAVLELNKEDQGNRTFILCTNNEVGEDKEKEFAKLYGNKEDNLKEWKDWEEKYGIARSITYKRMKKVIEGYTTPKGKEIEGIPANLKYYKTEYIDKQNDEDDDYEVEEEILNYVIELIQLEFGIDISNKGIGLVLSDMYGNLEGKYNVTKITKERLDEIKVLYVAEGLILPDNLVDELNDKNIDIRWVPKYYKFN